MSGAEYAVGERSLGESYVPPNAATSTSKKFKVTRTVISQFANSPVLLALVNAFSEWLDPADRFDQFFDLVWNVDNAEGWGLDVWGRIVGVGRVLQVPGASETFGFDQSPDAQPLSQGVFYRGATVTSNFRLSDNAYRRVILAKALANISDGSIPSINRILMQLFPGYGNCYVTDGGDMTMTYTFGDTLSAVDFAIVMQSGILPKPAGVSVTVVQL